MIKCRYCDLELNAISDVYNHQCPKLKLWKNNSPRNSNDSRLLKEFKKKVKNIILVNRR